MDKSDVRKMLISEVRHLNDEIFHHLCFDFVKELYQKEFKNTGINSANRPVGHDVDTVSVDNEIICEFSVDKDYFVPSKKFKKLRNDLDHAIKRKPKPKEIVLISNQSVTNKNRRLIEYGARILCFRHRVKINLYDATRLVDEIIHFSNKSLQFHQNCSEHLKLFKRLMILNGSDGLFPPLPVDYVKRPKVEKAFYNHVSKNSISLLHGISGVGKTVLMLKLKDLIGKNIEFPVWIEGHRLGDITNLSNYELKLNGYQYDLTRLLEESSVLLCVDSVESNDKLIEDLSKISLRNKSKIVISSQKKIKLNKVHLFELQGMAKKEFLKMFNTSNTNEEQVVNDLFESSHGNPLVSTIVSKLVKNNDLSFDDLKSELENIGDVEVDRGETLVERILKNHINVIKKGIEFISVLNSKKINRKMIKFTIGQIEVTKLLNRGFLLEQDEDSFVVHDLLFSVVGKCFEAQQKEAIEDKLLLFLKNEGNDLTEYELNNLSHEYFEFLSAQAFEKKSPIALYIVSSFTEVDSQFQANQYEKEFTDFIKSLDFDSVDYYSIMAVIEYYELMYRYYEYEVRDKEKSKGFISLGISFCERALAKANVTDFELNIKHHLGKYFRLNKEIEKAYECYKNILSINENFYETKLQLFRIQHWVQNDSRATDAHKEAVKDEPDVNLITSILDKAKENFNDVAPSVLLFSFQELRKSPFYSIIDDLLGKYEKLFYEVIKKNQYEDEFKFIEVLGGVGGRFLNKNPELFEKEISSLNLPGPQVSSRKILFNMGQLYFSLACAKKDLALLDLAGAYYQNIVDNKKTGDFDLSHIVNFYNIVGDYDTADYVYNKIKNKDAAFVCMRRAWTLYGKSEQPLALVEIDKGIKNLDSHLHGYHMKSFLDLKEIIENTGVLEDSTNWGK